MSEPTEEDRQRQRADELRARIEDLKRGARDSSQPESPREFTDNAASEAAGRDDPTHDEDAE
jgi:hypothetical protein